MEDAVYITSDCSGMSEDDLRFYIRELKGWLNDFAFDNWFSIEDFIDECVFYRLREEFK
jgi:hypothetical protein